MIVKEIELVESYRDLNLGVSLTPYSLRLNQIKVTSSFKVQIARAQKEDLTFNQPPSWIMDCRVKQLRSKTVALAKVA